MKKTKAFTFAAMLVLLMLSAVLYASATTVPTFTLYASSTQLQFLLPVGTTFNGSISTTGTLRFWVSAPNGAQIVNLGLIDKAGTFSFVAPQDGNYSLNFENDLFNSIQVTFSYTTNPDVSIGGNQPEISTIYLIIPATVAVIGSILIILFVRRRKRKKSRINGFNPLQPIQ